MLRLTEAGLAAFNAYMEAKCKWDSSPPNKVLEREKQISKRHDVMFQLADILMENGTPPDEVCAAYWTIEKHFGLPIITTCEIPPIGIESELSSREDDESWLVALAPYSNGVELLQPRPKNKYREKLTGAPIAERRKFFSELWGFDIGEDIDAVDESSPKHLKEFRALIDRLSEDEEL